MMTSKIIYTGGLRAKCIHLESNTSINTDAPKDNHGKGEAFSPTDLIATSLASCILTTIGIVATRENFTTIDGATADVTKVMYAEPRRIGEIIIKITFPALNYSDKEKNVYEHTAHTCPVSKSLHPDLKQVIEFIW